MDYKEKYEQALERARQIHNQTEFDYEKGMMEEIFPELEESKDEKIRKAIKKALQVKCCDDEYGRRIISDESVTLEEALAWLEKQEGCKQKNKINSYKITFEEVLALECAMKTVKITEGGDKLYEILVPLYNKIHNAYLAEKQDEKKCINDLTSQESMDIAVAKCFEGGEKESSDKVKPKFKVGDWVVNRFGDVWHIDSFDNKNYQVSNGNGYNYFPISKQNKMHLWTIQDAKDGDVLTNGEIILIFKHFEEPAYMEHIIAYIGLDISRNIQVTDGYWQLGVKASPATKEQRDLLFNEMRKSGYRWDADKKELEKIVIDDGKAEMDYCFTKMMAGEKVSPTWSEEDEEEKSKWKDAQGDDLPQIDKVVAVLCQPYPLEDGEYSISFAHRPNPDGWDGKSISTGKIEHYTPETYGKGGWNIPNVIWWLDMEFPKKEEEV